MEANRNNRISGERYLTFEVEEETYGIPILKVKEILGMREITPLPQTPPSVRGVINLRGLIVPVVDLRLKFGLTPRVFDKRTSIIVLDLVWADDLLLMGMIVDTVHEVQSIPSETVSQLAGYETRVKAQYIHGIADTQTGIRILLDVDKVLTEEDLRAVTNKEAS